MKNVLPETLRSRTNNYMTFDTGSKVKCTTKTCHSLTFNKVYEVYEYCQKPNEDNSIIRLYDDNNDLLWYYIRNFTSEELNLQHFIDEGKKLVDKECITGVGVNSTTFTPNTLLVVIDDKIVKNYSISVVNDYKKYGFSVVVYDSIRGHSFPVRNVKLAPKKFIKMKLGDYDAEVHDNNVVVGCQVISFKEVEALYEHMKSLQ